MWGVILQNKTLEQLRQRYENILYKINSHREILKKYSKLNHKFKTEKLIGTIEGLIIAEKEFRNLFKNQDGAWK